MTTASVIAHLVLVVALLAAYVTLTALGHDGNAILALLGGQALGAGVQKATGEKA